MFVIDIIKQEPISLGFLSHMDKKLKECQKQRDEYLAGWQRAKADFLNYKKEEAKRTEKIKEYVREDLLLKMLDIHDDLERAREHAPDDEWIKGILQIENQFHSLFKEHGIERIKTDKFDPRFHEAIEGEGEHINEVVQKGYLIKGRVLRPAKVKVKNICQK